MADRIVETRDAVVVSDRPVAPGGAAATVASPYSRTARIIRIITSILLGLLAIRFMLSLLGANQENLFASLIYGVTYPFVMPFFGLFGYDMQYGVARLEIETLVAIAVYALAGYSIARLVAASKNRA